MQYNIILASSSPRRIEMFRNHDINPIIKHPNVDERVPDSLGVEESAMHLALKKGLTVEEELVRDPNNLSDKTYIVSADTIVYKDKTIGKPQDIQEAYNILKYLRNTNHFVITGVSIILAGTSVRKVFYDTTEVFFGNYSDDEIKYYISNENVLDKAGSYAIQSDIWKKNVTKIVGDYNNIVGFPWDKFQHEFENLLNPSVE